MSIQKLVCTWTYGAGSPGYSVFYATGQAGAQMLFSPFWQAVAPYLPPSVSINTPNTGDVIDETTGKKTGTWGTGVVTNTVGTAVAAYAAPCGGRINWSTNAFVNGHKVAGKTYLVPLGSANYSTTGTISSACSNSINAAAVSLYQNSGGALVIWHRPVYDLSTKPPTLKTPGSVHPIVGAATPTKVSVLTSRRDS